MNLPAGKHRLLLRGRGACRLFVDEKKLLETSPRPDDPGGYELLSVQDEYLDLGPDFRFAPPGNRDTWCEFETKGGEHFVSLNFGLATCHEHNSTSVYIHSPSAGPAVGL